MARKLAEHLARAGHQATVIVPRRQNQLAVEEIQGVRVLSFSPADPVAAHRLIRECQAPIFHSQDPTVLSFLAQRIHPRRVHLITCRDPRDRHDWWIEFMHATGKRRMLTPLNYLTESGPLVRHAVRHADGVYVPAQFLRDKVRRMYRLRDRADFLPNLIDVPEVLLPKGATPTFTFLARWDRRKRPELFLDLARRFPQYRFVAAGQGSASAESSYDAELRSRYRNIPNLEMPGFINRFTEPERMHQLLAETWVLVSPAVREGLPLSFLEAAAYGCAILSGVDPDGFASRFGRRVIGEDFAGALAALIEDAPLARGEAARAYVRQWYETSRALDIHLNEYRNHAGT
jgi:glycosyltransferase involved in cell wall biosynthesis